MEHPARACLAEILVTHPDGTTSRGSGYLVATGWVLTAAHVVHDATGVGVWVGSPTDLRPQDGHPVDPGAVRTIPGTDLALLPVPAAATPPGYVRPLLGALDRADTDGVGVVAVGFPWFKLRPAPGRPEVTLREVRYATGRVVGASNAKTGTLELHVTDPPDPHPNPDRSSWEGMSGGPVFAHAHLVAVVGQHHPTESTTTLTARPLRLPDDIATTLGLPPDPVRAAWADLLPQLAEPLPAVTPATARDLASRRAQAAARPLLPEDGVLIAREVELADLAAFATGEQRWRWIRAEAFAGKTALLAYFALHPPETVDVVACFLRSTTGGNTAAHALKVLDEQLAGLLGRAGYTAPTTVADLVFDLHDDLLLATAQAARQTGRHLLVLIDGLDEYAPTEPTTLATWLPAAANLPDGVHVLVTSRAGVDVHLPERHPLTAPAAQHKLVASDVASQIRHLAQDELDTAFRAGTHDPLKHAVAACLAATGGGISITDLNTWLVRRGTRTAADSLEYLTDQIGVWFHRSVHTTDDPYGSREQVLVFAHETLSRAFEAKFTASLTGLREEIHTWADEYQTRGWPPDTPGYLLTGYPRLLTTLRDGEGLADLVTDGGWLHRAVLLLGVDRTVDVIASAREILDRADLVVWAFSHRPVDAVERSLRRSRITLARDVRQLAAQVHARLSHDDNERLSGLGDLVGQVAGEPWLRMVEGRLDWSSDLESVYPLVGKVRGVAFGVVDEGPIVAIAVDTKVVLWDPRRGARYAGEIDVGVRPTAVAVAAIDGRDVVVTTAGYDGRTDVWDITTQARIRRVDTSLGHRLAVGLLDGRQVIAGALPGGEILMLDTATLDRVEAHPDLRLPEVVGFGLDEDHLVVLRAESAPASRDADGSVHAVVVVDPADGREIWRSVDLPAGPSDRVDVASGARIGPVLMVAAGIGTRTWWLTEGAGHIEQSPHGVRMRSLAVGVADGRPVVVSAPDLDATTLVELHEVGYRQTGDSLELFRTSSYVADQRAAAWFDDVPLPDLISWHQGAPPNGPFTRDAPERWPHTATARGEVDGVPVLLTGSVEGSAWLWDTWTDPPSVIAGPFTMPTSTTLAWGWRSLAVKPAASTATSVALGHDPSRNALAAVACNGRVRLYTVAGEERIEGPWDNASVVDAVALGELHERLVLITGSKGGVVILWDLADSRRVAALTLDDPVKQLAIAPGPHGRGQVAVKAGADRLFVLDLVEP